jgi:predicted ArsR family transcriptional regulator
MNTPMTRRRAEPQVSLPDELDSPRAKLVYLYLSMTGDATVIELQRALGLSKLALFSILDTLTTDELVQQTETGYAC